MLTLTIAPPEVIGSSEAAELRQRTTRASAGEKATPSEANKKRRVRGGGEPRLYAARGVEESGSIGVKR